MAQLFFEPSATKIGEDDWLVVPKNNQDTIDVISGTNHDGESTVVSGTYKGAIRCSTLIKDVLLKMWGQPEMVNGVLTGHAHSEDIISDLCEEYSETWLPEEDKYLVKTEEGDQEFDTLKEAMTFVVNMVKSSLRQSKREEEQENDDGNN